MPSARVSTASVAVCLAYLLFRLVRKVVASVCAGSRVWRKFHSIFGGPHVQGLVGIAKAGSVCKNRNINFESAKGYVGYKWDMVTKRAQFMGGARRALMHNFRGKYDIINTAEVPGGQILRRYQAQASAQSLQTAAPCHLSGLSSSFPPYHPVRCDPGSSTPHNLEPLKELGLDTNTANKLAL
eukprot:976126-Pelagomonas_calceolata.AAC.1